MRPGIEKSQKELDELNYLAIELLEELGHHAPTQDVIDFTEQILNALRRSPNVAQILISNTSPKP